MNIENETVKQDGGTAGYFWSSAGAWISWKLADG
jgi:hypothetical protein